MTRKILLDTGPLVALLDRNDRYHAWAAAHWGGVTPPLMTCEAVLTEACYLLRQSPGGVNGVMEMLRRGIVTLPFRLEEHVAPVSRLLAKYADLPMSLADACLVCMAEIDAERSVLTLDSDFHVYRKSNRQVVPAITPEA